MMTLFVIDNGVIRFGEYRCHADWARSTDSHLDALRLWGRVDPVEAGIWLFRDAEVEVEEVERAIVGLAEYFPLFPVVRREVARGVDDPCGTRGRVGW